MHNKIINRASVIIVVFTLITVVAAATYMGIKIYDISTDAEMLNEAVQTSEDIAEMAAAADSEESFETAVQKIYTNAAKTKKGLLIKCENSTIINVIINEENIGSGTLMKVSINTSYDNQELYSLSTEKYLSAREAGEKI